jgi:hypothetical protein
MLVRGLLIWCALLLTAVINGAFREAVLVPRTGAQVGHVVSSISLSLFILLVTYLAIPWIRPSSPSQALLIGMVWLALTLAFEFGFGRYRGKPWAELLTDYNLFRGRVWIVVLLVTLIAPLLTARMRGLFAGGLKAD